MKKLLNRKIIVAITLTLMLSFAFSTLALPTTMAHIPAWNIPTYAYLAITPNPVGINQPVFVVMWIDKVPPSAVGANGDRWTDFKVEITKPDATKETLGPFISDATSSTFTSYNPNQIGTYTFTFTFPGQVASAVHPVTGIKGIASDYINDTYLPSSATATLTVQQEAIAPVEDYPLPTEYWSRPIEGQNTNWATVGSNWLGGSQIFNNVQIDGVAPSSSHVMWAIPLQNGGIVGGKSTSIPGISYYAGMSYEGKFASPIIIQGKLYYPIPLSNNPQGGLGGSALSGGYACVDLQTGERVWWQNYTANPTFGQIYDYESMNQHGAISYLWAASGTTWIAYEPETGNWLFNLTGVPSGTQDYTANGEIVRYVLNVQNNWLALWNSTAAPTLAGSTDPTNWMLNAYRPVGKIVDASTAYSWNVTIPTLAPGTSIRQVIADDMLLVSSGNFGGIGAGITGGTITAISIKPATRGQMLWTKNYPAPEGNVTRQFVFADPQTRTFFMLDKETMAYWAFSLDNGNQIWGPVTIPNAYDYYTSTVASYNNGARSVAYGNLYVTGFGGITYAFDAKTGQLKWTYGNGGEGNSTNSGLDTPWGNYPTFIGAIADGKIYLFNSEHSPNAPLYKGEKIRCLDAITGRELWAISGWGQSGLFYSANGAVADGFYAYLNSYDQRIYCIGKGPSAVTVQAPQSAVNVGSPIIISGTVSDQSAGAKQLINQGKYQLVPAMSDADQNKWMEYLYMQKPKPNDAVGVTIKLTLVDSTGISTLLGTTKSDIYGKYGFAWTPTNTGTYQIVATFETTNSYWGAQDATYITIGAASAQPTTSPTPTSTVSPIPTSTPTASSTVTPTISPSVAPPAEAISTETLLIAATAVVIIIAVIAAALILRKRK